MSTQDTVANGSRQKLFGRAFYESLGSPKFVLAPMVDQSEFAWRMLTRSFMPPESSKTLLAYSPMLHSRLFADTAKYREQNFEPLRTPLSSSSDTYQQLQIDAADWHLDGNPALDRPLFVQFCSNSPQDLLAAARYVEPFCDAVDLNLGCPQGIARKGHYGAFLQEDWDLIYRLINILHKELSIPVTAKMRILDTKEKTLEYAKMILSAGASIITVHGRQREQKGHNTGLADWSVIRYLRESLPPDTVIFANGNILQHDDIAECLQATGADGVMSAEGNLYDPSIFAIPPSPGHEGREYWRGRDGKGGYRMDAVLRRYMDIMHKYVLQCAPPERRPLFLPSDSPPGEADVHTEQRNGITIIDVDESDEPPKKKQRKDEKRSKLPKEQQRTIHISAKVMQAHLFHMLRPLVSKHTNVRDALAKARAGDIDAFENVLSMVEEAVKQGLIEYELESKHMTQSEDSSATLGSAETVSDPTISSTAAVERCRRPWFICQSHVRPLPAEALEKGALSLSKKEKARLAQDEALSLQAAISPNGTVQTEQLGGKSNESVEIPKEGMVCG